MSTKQVAKLPNPDQMWRALFELDNSMAGMDKFLCPICSNDYVHHEATAEIIPGNDNYEAHPHVRSAVIRIPFHCENGCRWQMMIGFHKGMTYVWCERLPDTIGDEPPTHER